MSPQSRHETVLLTGATGQVGIFVLPRLLAAGYSVVALSRKIPAAGLKGEEQGVKNLCWFHPDSLQTSGISSADGQPCNILHRVDVLISCGPVELAARLAPLCPQLQRVICISTSSVYTKLASPVSAERRLIGQIKAAEQTLIEFCQSIDIPLILLRPTLIYGCGLDRNVSRIAHLARRIHFVPLAGRAAGLRQPVHADDLAKLLLILLAANQSAGLDCPVCGGSVLTYREMVQQVFSGLGLAARTVQIPAPFLTWLASTVAWLPSTGGLNAGFILRQNQDLIFDDSHLRDQLGFDPRAFEPRPEDFEVPAYARTLQPP